MKKNIIIVLAITLLFLIVFWLGNRDYFLNSAPIVHNGKAIISSNELKENSNIKLNGQWSFYPNILISPNDSFNTYKDRHILIDVPSNINSLLERNQEGLNIGTYQLKIKVPTEGDYGLYIRTIRQANRIFINGEEVGAKGNPSASVQDFNFENDDKYIVFAKSKNYELNIVIHVGNYNYPKSGIIFPIEFGTKETIQKEYHIRVMTNVIISIGYIVFGIIYLISFSQNRKRKEELFFGLFAILLGVYMSLINQKLFFLIMPKLMIIEQIRLQLGILPLVIIFFTLFVHYMFPQFMTKINVYTIFVILISVFFIYGILSPYDNKAEMLIILQIAYVGTIISIILYNLFILIRVLFKRIEGAHYILVILVSICCYSSFLGGNFLFDIPIDYIELLLFVIILLSFASLLNFRANVSFEEVQSLSKELIAHNQMKDEFLLKTSKELKEMLYGILNLSKSLMEGTKGPLKRPQQEQIILMHNVTKRLGHLVDDLQLSSSLMSGEISISPSIVSAKIINEVVEEIRYTNLDISNVTIISKVDTALPAMFTDELRLKQVLYNLLYNAIQHTKNGQITVEAHVDKQQMVIDIIDTGTGIPSHELELIFNAFYQGKNSVGKDGLGLGLSITKNIVKNLNGDIYVKSELGEGTTFTFTIPLANDIDLSLEKSYRSVSHINERVAQSLLAPHYKMKEKKILLVDEDQAHLQKLSNELSLQGYTIISIENGFAALEYIKENQVDCMIIDLLMNKMSGYDLCKEVRKKYDMLELPIVVMTSMMKYSDLKLTLQFGANDYLQKPINVDELNIRIDSLLAVRQSSLEAIDIEMNYLYSQVTPHFIYNTLNTIIGLSYTDEENAREALYCLATYFRAKLNVHYHKNLVSIEDEIELVKSYLYIEKLRFGNQLTVKYDIDETIKLLIPALSIQPLVENAVSHGISKKKGGGTIEISVQREGQFICIKIYDNGVGISEEKIQQLLNGESSRIGFMNPLKKLKLIKNASLQLYSKEGHGTTIVILLPEGGRV